MEFFWIVVAIAIIYLLIKRNKKQPIVNVVDNETPEIHKISEEAVFKYQTQFEEDLRNTYLPDAPSGNEIYIYWNLMKKWYEKLSAKHRYDEEMTQKLRSDWIDYMQAVRDRNTYNYLSLELEDEDKQKHYREEHIVASRKVFAIEDAFAAAIGKEAEEELTKIKAKDYWAFSRDGQLAPEGFMYSLNGELEPVDN